MGFFAFIIVITRSKQKVKIQQLSQIISENCPNSTIDLLKIDIEGHELSALKGLNSRDWKKVQAIIMEVHPQNKEEVFKIVKNEAFKILSIEKGVLSGTNSPEVIIAKRVPK